MVEYADMLGAVKDVMTLLAGKAPSVLIVAALGWMAYVVLSRVLRQFRRQEWVTRTMEGRIRVTLRWIMYLVVGLVMLQAAGLFSDAWAVLSGFFAVAAVSFVAMWSVLSNGVCAVLIMVYRPFELGDDIEIMDPANLNRFSGRVTDINLMFTELRAQDDDGRRLRLQVPNNMIMQKVVRRFES